MQNSNSAQSRNPLLNLRSAITFRQRCQHRRRPVPAPHLRSLVHSLPPNANEFMLHSRSPRPHPRALVSVRFTQGACRRNNQEAPHETHLSNILLKLSCFHAQITHAHRIRYPDTSHCKLTLFLLYPHAYPDCLLHLHRIFLYIFLTHSCTYLPNSVCRPCQIIGYASSA